MDIDIISRIVPSKPRSKNYSGVTGSVMSSNNERIAELQKAIEDKLDKAVFFKMFSAMNPDMEVIENYLGTDDIASIRANYDLFSQKGVSAYDQSDTGGSGTGGVSSLYMLDDVNSSVRDAATGSVLYKQTNDEWGTFNLTSALGTKVDKVAGKGLSSNDFSESWLNKLKGIEEGANKYILKPATAALLGGIMVGSTLSVNAQGVLNYDLTKAKIENVLTGNITSHNHDSFYYRKSYIDDLFQKVNVGTAASPVWAIRANYPLFSVGGLSAYGYSQTGGEVPGGLDEDLLWSILGNNGLEQISKNHLTTALSDYATIQRLSSYATINQLSNYATTTSVNTALANKVNSTRKIIAGDGLIGGGDLTSDVTFRLGMFGTAGTYYKVITDKYGRVSSGAKTLSVSDITNLQASLDNKLNKDDFYKLFTVNKKADGSIESVQANFNFFSVSGISAYGFSNVGGGSGSINEDQLWSILGNSGTEQIAKNHLTTALSGYATIQILNDYVDRTSEQTISGKKTFLSDLKIDGILNVDQNTTVTNAPSVYAGNGFMTNRYRTNLLSFSMYTNTQKWLGMGCVGTDTIKFGASSFYHSEFNPNLKIKVLVNGDVYANKFIVDGPNGFLKANGDIDTNTYLTSHQSIYNLTFQAGQFTAKTFDPNSAAATVNIPTHTSHLTNNSGFLTQHQSLANYVTRNTDQDISGEKTFTGGIYTNYLNMPVGSHAEIYGGTAFMEGSYVDFRNPNIFFTDASNSQSTRIGTLTLTSNKILSYSSSLIIQGDLDVVGELHAGSLYSNRQKVATQNWVNDQNYLTSANLANYIDKTSQQDITGLKTFKNNLTVSNIVYSKGDGNRGLEIDVNGFHFIAATGNWARGMMFYNNAFDAGLGAAVGAYGTGNTLTYYYYGASDYANASMYITPSNKYIGLGTKTPTEKLDVIGNVKATGFKVSGRSGFLKADGGVDDNKYLTSYTNNYLTGVSGSGNGNVTFARAGLTALTWNAAHNHRILLGKYTTRPTNINIAATSDRLNSLEKFNCSGSVTGKPPVGDSHILHLNWDNAGGWDTQIAVGVDNAHMAVRRMTGTNNTWGAWNTILDETNYNSFLDNSYLKLTGGKVTGETRFGNYHENVLIPLVVENTYNNGTTTGNGVGIYFKHSTINETNKYWCLHSIATSGYSNATEFQLYSGWANKVFLKVNSSTGLIQATEGSFAVNMTRDTSAAKNGLSFTNVAGGVVSYIGYHNTEQRLFLSAKSNSEWWTDQVGKYQLKIGVNSLTYNTYEILRSDNYSSFLNSQYLRLTGGIVTGTTLFTGGKAWKALVGTSSITDHALFQCLDVNGNSKGYIAVGSSFKYSNGSNLYDVIHSGNIGSQSVNYANTAGGLKSFSSSSTAGTYTNQYTKIASIRLTSQYSNAQGVIAVYGSGDGNMTMGAGILSIRVKQQHSMGGTPYVSLYYIPTATGYYTSANFKAVVVSNTTTETVVDFYLHNTVGYNSMIMRMLSGDNVTLYSSQGYSPTLPSGTVVTCASVLGQYVDRSSDQEIGGKKTFTGGIYTNYLNMPAESHAEIWGSVIFESSIDLRSPGVDSSGNRTPIIRFVHAANSSSTPVGTLELDENKVLTYSSGMNIEGRVQVGVLEVDQNTEVKSMPSIFAGNGVMTNRFRNNLLSFSMYTNTQRWLGMGLVGADTVKIGGSDSWQGIINKAVKLLVLGDVNATGAVTGNTLDIASTANVYDLNVERNMVVTGTQTVLPGHYYHKFYSGGNIYIHYYPNGSDPTVTTNLNFRLWNNSTKALQVLNLTGTGTFTWGGKDVLLSGNAISVGAITTTGNITGNTSNSLFSSYSSAARYLFANRINRLLSGNPQMYISIDYSSTMKLGIGCDNNGIMYSGRTSSISSFAMSSSYACTWQHYGAFKASGSITPSTTSDRRLKTNIKPLQRASNIIKTLNFYEYDYKKQALDNDSGLIPHSVGMIYDEVIGTKLSDMAMLQDSGYGSLNYISSNYINIIAASVKEMIERTDILENKMTNVESRIALLEKENKELKEIVSQLKAA